MIQRTSPKLIDELNAIKNQSGQARKGHGNGELTGRITISMVGLREIREFHGKRMTSLSSVTDSREWPSIQPG